MMAYSPDNSASHALPFVALGAPSLEKLLSYHSSTKCLNFMNISTSFSTFFSLIS